MSNFSVNVVVSGARCDLLVAGELDLLTANLVAELGLINLEPAGVQQLVIDLRDVSFMDGRGIRALVTLRNAADKLGKSVTVANPHSRVRGLLALTGLEEAFAPEPQTTQSVPRTILSGVGPLLEPSR